MLTPILTAHTDTLRHVTMISVAGPIINREQAQRVQRAQALSDGCGNAIEFKGLTDIANVYAVKESEAAMA